MIDRFRMEIDVLKEEMKMLWVLVISSGAAGFKMLFKFSEIYFSEKEWTLDGKLHFMGAIFCFAIIVLTLMGIIRRNKRIRNLLDQIENIKEE